MYVCMYVYMYVCMHACLVPLQNLQAPLRFKSLIKNLKGFFNQHGHFFLSLQDNNGYIEDTELMAFLKDLLEKKDMVIITYCRTMCLS